MRPATKPSSAMLTTTLENGSGDAFTTTRVAALAPCANQREPGARDRERHRVRFGVAPFEDQRAGDGAEERVHRVPRAVEVRDLVHDELDHDQRERRRDHPRFLEEGGAVDPVETAADTEDGGHRVHADPG